MGIKIVERMLGMCDALVEEAAELVEPTDEAELVEFAARLCGLGPLTREGRLAATAGMTVPGDFRHLRLTNLTQNRPWGGIFNIYQQPLAFEDLLVKMSIAQNRDDVTPTGRGVWIETIALPIKDPGVLELGMRFAPLH